MNFHFIQKRHLNCLHATPEIIVGAFNAEYQYRKARTLTFFDFEMTTEIRKICPQLLFEFQLMQSIELSYPHRYVQPGLG